ncbi:MAG: glycosyltransferase family 2 protein [Atopobiaceae bacterium]|nr:glycosyltransferase family 2 protein [Atopobiaceae bacterium]
MPRVSIVIPVYNVEQWLPDCLDSVLAQTFADFEAICVDDCSPDGCHTILEDYSARDPRIRVMKLETNSGQGVARNVGFDASTGDYVYFLDSDDMVAPNALEELVDRADADRLDGILFDSEVVFETPELAKRHRSYPSCHTGRYREGVYRGLELFESMVEQYDWTCYVQRQFWRSSFLRENGIAFPRFAPHEDEGFAFEAMALAERVIYLPRRFFIRRYRTGSVMTSRMGVRNLRSYIQALCLMIEKTIELGLHGNAVRSNTARIFFACRRIQESLEHEGIDPLPYFEEDPELLGKYLVFAASQDYWRHYGLLTPHVRKLIDSSDRVWIYGAGAIANDVFDSLAFSGHAIEGFLVTDAADNPPAFKGHHVHALADVPVDPEALVVVSVTDGFRADVEASLDEAGWTHVYFKDGGA